MKFLVGFIMEGEDYITIVEVEDERDIRKAVCNKIRNTEIEIKNFVLVKKRLFEREKQYLVKFRYDHIMDIQVEMIFAKNMIEAMEIFENVCKRPDRYFIKSVEKVR